MARENMPGDEKPSSIWKKEMSFRRKPAAEGAPEPSSEPASPSGSIWKKEISLRKKAKDAPAEPEVARESVSEREPEHQPEFESQPEPQLPARLEPVAIVAPEPVHEPAPVVEHSWLTKPLEEISEPPQEEPIPLAEIPLAEFPPAEIPLVSIPLAVVESARVEPPPAEVPAEGPVFDAPTLVPPSVSLVPDEQATAAEEVIGAAAEHALELDLGLDLILPVVEDVPPVLAELPVDAVAVLPGLPELPELPGPPEPPLSAAEVAAPEAAPNVPFYKREVSLKRSTRERKPKAEKAPKQPRAKRERPAKPQPEDQSGEKVPFYKRELSLSLKRGPKEWDAAEPVSEPKQPKSKPVPKPKRLRSPRPSLSLPGSSSKKLVGLKIGGSQIAAARINNGASRELVQAVREPLEHGIVVGGELRDPDALATALREFFRLHKLPKRGVRLGIANNRIGVRTFEVVGIDDPKQLANAIRFRAQEVLPIPLEEAVLDYQVLSESVNEDGQKVSRVLLVVAYRELVDRYVYACKKAGLQVVGIDLEAFALLRAVAEPHDPVPGSERGALVAVSVGHDRSTFAVSDGRVCEFTRVLEWGGWALNIAIARALDTAPSEAEPLKRALSFTGTVAVPEGFTEDQLTTAREAARRQLQTFARELVSSLQFYQNQPGSLSIGEIVLTGGTAHLPGLGGELERLIGVPVRVADPLTRLKVSKKTAEQDQLGSLAIAIGLGIDD